MGGGVRMSWAQYAKLKGLPQKGPRRRKGEPKPESTLSELELAFLELWKRHGIPSLIPQPQYEFHATRKWRLDFSWPHLKVAVELHGGEFMKKSGHTTGRGLAKDCEKSRRAQIEGWIVLPFTGKEIKSKPLQCVEEVVEAINIRRK